MPAPNRKRRGSCRGNTVVALSTWIGSVLLLNVIYIHNNLPPMLPLMAAHDTAWEKHRKVRDLTDNENLAVILQRYLRDENSPLKNIAVINRNNSTFVKTLVSTLKSGIGPNDTYMDNAVCFTPSRRPACTVQHYDIFAVVEAEMAETTVPRTLLLNCMKWLLDPSVRYIFVILPNATKPLLESDKAYGRRILQWSESSRTAVRVVFAQNPVSDGLSACGRILEEQAMLPVLWMNASREWNGGNSTLQTMFQTWRRKPDSLIAQSIWVRSSTSDADSVRRIGSSNDNVKIGSWLVDMNAVFFHPSFLCILLRASTILRNVVDVASLLSQSAAASQAGFAEDIQPFLVLNSTRTDSESFRVSFSDGRTVSALFARSPRPFFLKSVSFFVSNLPDCK